VYGVYETFDVSSEYSWGVICIVGYKKEYLVKIGVSFIGNMYWEEGSTKGFF
jgi:hypothetical protein